MVLRSQPTFRAMALMLSLRMTPAMAAGVSDTLHDMEWIVGLIDTRAPEPKRPKTYKKRA